MEVVEDVADDDADVRGQVVDKEAKGDLSKSRTIDLRPECSKAKMTRGKK